MLDGMAAGRSDGAGGTILQAKKVILPGLSSTRAALVLQRNGLCGTCLSMVHFRVVRCYSGASHQLAVFIHVLKGIAAGGHGCLDTQPSSTTSVERMLPVRHD